MVRCVNILVFVTAAALTAASPPVLAQETLEAPAAEPAQASQLSLEEERLQRGAVLAGDWCAPCHALNGPTASDAAPPMAVLARLEAPVLRAFLSQPHPPMPPLALANDEIDDLLTFLKTLRAD